MVPVRETAATLSSVAPNLAAKPLRPTSTVRYGLTECQTVLFSLERSSLYYYIFPLAVCIKLVKKEVIKEKKEPSRKGK